MIFVLDVQYPFASLFICIGIMTNNPTLINPFCGNFNKFQRERGVTGLTKNLG